MGGPRAAASRSAWPTCWSTTIRSTRRGPSWGRAAWSSWTSPPAWWTWPATSSPSSRRILRQVHVLPHRHEADAGVLTRITEGKGEEKDVAELEDLAAQIKITRSAAWARRHPTPFSPRFGISGTSTTTISATSAAPPRSARRSSGSASTRTAAPAACCAPGSAQTKAAHGERKKAHVIDQATCVRCGLCHGACRSTQSKSPRERSPFSDEKVSALKKD